MLLLLLLTPCAINSTPFSPSASHSFTSYLWFSWLLIVSIPCYCLSLLGINLSNKLSSHPHRCLFKKRQVCKILSSPHWLRVSDGCPFFEGVIICHKVNCDSFSLPSRPPALLHSPPLLWPCVTHPHDAVNCGSGEVCLTSFQGHALLGPFSPLKGHIISQPPTSH